IQKEPGLKVVASQTANWERDQGFNVFQNILQSHPAVRGLFACSDLMALGAVEAIAAANKTGKIAVIGFDAFDEAREAVRRGTMVATIAQSPATMALRALKNAVRLIQGESVPETIPVDIKLITNESEPDRK